ncbi:MAG: L,D-transpeptidase family protein [Polymorphobacter sp.]
MKPTRRLLLAAALLLPLTPVLGQGATVSSALDLARAADTLKPGQWVFAPALAPAGPVVILVDLSRQLATVYRNGVRIGVSTVSTGKPGHETPTGVFTILQKDANHHSSLYNNAPMKFQERLTWDGVALHAGGLPGYPESHGCVHLPLEFSKELFAVTTTGMTVIVAGRAGSVATYPAAGVLAPLGVGGSVETHVPLAGNEAYRWTPEIMPVGPLTIVVSQSDNRVIAMRNGVEIGRAKAMIDPPGFGTLVLVLASDTAGRAVWHQIDVPGHAGETQQPADAGILQNVHMPAGFYAALQGQIVPGTTVLLTGAPVVSTTTGVGMAVLSATKS